MKNKLSVPVKDGFIMEFTGEDYRFIKKIENNTEGKNGN
jgi:hypothetical protein